MSAESARAELAAKPGATAVLAALGELGGEASPAELAAAAGLAPRTSATWAGQLAAVGLVERTKALVRLTELGRHHLPGPATLAGVGADLDPVLEQVWPSEFHRAFLRLLLSAIVARHHLRRHRPSGHLGFVAAGETSTGKSAMADFACNVFALAPAEHRVFVPTQTAGSLYGRRERNKAGTKFSPAPFLARPFVVLEEADKGTPEQWAKARGLLQGETDIEEEGARIDIACTPLIAANTDPGQLLGLIRPEYVRRSVVLDTWHLSDFADELPARLRALELAGGPPLISLEACAPPAAFLDDDAVAITAHMVTGALLDRLWHPQALELAALGRAGLLGLDADRDAFARVAYETAIDFLVCAETTGRVRPGWVLQVPAGREALDASPDLARMLGRFEELKADRQVVTAAVVRRRSAGESEDLELIRERHEAAERLAVAAASIERPPTENRAEAKGIREALRKARTKILDARTADALAAAVAVAEPLRQAAVELRARIDQAKSAATAAVADRRQEEAFARHQAKRVRDQSGAEAKAAKASARRRLTDLRKNIKPLETAYRSKGLPLDQLAKLQRLDGTPLVTFERFRSQPKRGFFVGWADAYSDRPAPTGYWVSATGNRWEGGPAWCPELEQCEGTRTALLPVIADAYASEIALEGRAGAASRKRLAIAPAPLRR